MAAQALVSWFEDLSAADVARVGGKNASLGEMIRNLSTQGVRVPGGFAVTARAYWEFLDANDLRARIADRIDALHHGAELAEVGAAVHRMFLDADVPPRLDRTVRDSYRELGRRLGGPDPDVAVRSSATAEDLPEASFAGQQETFVHIVGEEPLLEAVRRCYASLFTDRAISYRDTTASTTSPWRCRSACSRWSAPTAPGPG